MEKSGGYPEDMFIDEVRIAIINYILFSHATYIIYTVNHIIIIFVEYYIH